MVFHLSDKQMSMMTRTSALGWLLLGACFSPPQSPDAGAPDAGQRGVAVVQLAADAQVSCALYASGAFGCGGLVFDGERQDYISESADYVQVQAGFRFACALRRDGEVDCIGAPVAPELEGVFVRLSSGGGLGGGGHSSCGIRADGTVVCARSYSPPFPIPEDIAVVDVSTNGRDVCAIRAVDQGLECWGDSDLTPPIGRFTSVSVSVGHALSPSHACAIREDDDSIECWGSDTDGATASPSGAFRQLSAGAGYTCAVTMEQAALCWGDDSDGRSSPPDEAFLSVAAGASHSCGLTVLGQTECWGAGPHPPPLTDPE